MKLNLHEFQVQSGATKGTILGKVQKNINYSKYLLCHASKSCTLATQQRRGT
jgi:hypothetical protein